MKYWFVIQSETYNEEKNGGFLYAPKYQKNGRTAFHHENVKRIKRDDRIFCYCKSNIVAIAKALTDGYESMIPSSIKGRWNDYGFKVDVEYDELSKPIKIENYKDKYMRVYEPKYSPFDKYGGMNQGYLFEINKETAELFLNIIEKNDVIRNNNSFKEEVKEIIEETEQFDDINNGLIKSYTDNELKLKEADDSFELQEIGKRIRVKTDPKLKVTRMEKANFLCEVNKNHITFTSKKTKHQYLETHHIIPIEAQKEIQDKALDRMFNLISLCPICHKQVHYACEEEKREIFMKMYEIRKDEMLEHGFDIARINQIFNKYYLNKKED